MWGAEVWLYSKEKHVFQEHPHWAPVSFNPALGMQVERQKLLMRKRFVLFSALQSRNICAINLSRKHYRQHPQTVPGWPTLMQILPATQTKTHSNPQDSSKLKQAVRSLPCNQTSTTKCCWCRQLCSGTAAECNPGFWLWETFQRPGRGKKKGWKDRLWCSANSGEEDKRLKS